MSRLAEREASSIETQIDETSAFLLSEIAGKDENKEKVVRLICECAAELPEKTCIYTTLVGLINVKSYELGGQIVEALVQYLKECLRKEKWNEARFVIRFLADLVNCHVVNHASLIHLFETLIEVTMEESIPQVRSDFFIYCVLSCLPWVGGELSDKKEQELDQILNSIHEYLSNRKKPYMVSLRVFDSDTPHAQEDSLDSLWSQISTLRAEKWSDQFIGRIYHSFSGTLSEAVTHNIPEFTVPSHENNFVYPYPRVIFRLFDYTDVPDEMPTLPASNSIQRFLGEESVANVIQLYSFSRQDCAKALINLPCLASRLPADYFIVEVILAELFYLPKPRNLEIFHTSLLIELCKLKNKTLPPVLVQGMELLFERLDTMNTSCVERFSSFFAHILSNFSFRWTWNDWISAAKLDRLHPKQVFVREALLKLLRLSFYDQIVGLSDDLKPFLPPRPDPIAKYSPQDESLPSSVVQLLEAVQDGISAREPTIAPLDDVPQVDEYPGDLAKVNFFFNVFFNATSATITHFVSKLSRMSQSLTSLIESEEAQITVLRTLYEVWQNHQQFMVVAVERLLTHKLIDPAAIVAWIFSDHMSNDFMSFYVWEIIHKTVEKKLFAIVLQKDEIARQTEKLRKINSPDSGDVVGDDANDIPSEDQIERMEESVESMYGEAKDQLIYILKSMIGKIKNHMQKCESNGKSYKNYWFRWALFRLQQLLFQNHEIVFKYIKSFDESVFSVESDQHISLIFSQFCALRA